MKVKTIIACLVLLIFAITSNAQFDGGLKFGVNASRFTRDIDPIAVKSEYYDDYRGFNQSFHTGLNAGLFATYKFTRSTAVGAELLYSTRGASYRIRNKGVMVYSNSNEGGSLAPAYDSYNYRIGYIEIPLFIQQNIFDGATALDIYAGVAPSFATGGKRIYRYYDVVGVAYSNDQQKKKKPLQDIRNNNIFPFAGLKIGSETGFIDLRASYSYYPVFSKVSNPDGSNLSTMIWSVGLTAGIYL